VVNFVMNDKCAAGTGRFLDVMAAMLGLTIDRLAELGLKAAPRVSISSVCTVFAQQEVAQRLAEGVPLEEVLAGLHAALAGRIHRMVRRLRVEREVILTGGGAKNPALVRALEERLGVGAVVPSDPLVTGALGAALLAREAIERGEAPRTAQRLEEIARRGTSAAGAASQDDGRSGLAAAREGARAQGREGQLALPANGTVAFPPTGGLDVGSLFTKAVVVDGTRATFVVLPSRGNYRGVAEEALARALRRAGFERGDLAGLVATGLGAPDLSLARQVSEISCLAKGIFRLCPEAAMVMDIGGQASRVIRLGPAGVVKDFAVSGQCAAGSARLLEVIAHVVGVEVDELGPLSLRSREPAGFSAGCAVFAETEAISLLAQGTSKEDLLAGLHQSLAAKVVALARGAGQSGTCALSGGGAQDVGLVARLRTALGSVLVPPEPMVVAALGAALLAAGGGR
jgi:predicted CoA-substrate-specific enzyme activase